MFVKKTNLLKHEKVLLNGLTLKEISRDVNQLHDTSINKVYYSFNEQGNEVIFSLSCFLDKTELFSDQAYSLILDDESSIKNMFFKIPHSHFIILDVKDEHEESICVEVLKTGKYRFIDKSNGFFEVQVNGHFYMYMQKE